MNTTWYSAAVQFYNQELSNIGQRNSAFLVVQSILIVALATFLSNSAQFPYVLIAIVWAICILGSLFCLLHFVSGRTGAMVASNWRRYMSHLENRESNAPWVVFYSYSKEEKRGRCSIGLSVEDLLKRTPWPSTWIITSIAFAVVWFGISIYLVVRSRLSDDPLFNGLPDWLSLGWTQILSIVILVATFIVLCFLIKGYIRWWGEVVEISGEQDSEGK